MIVIRNAARCDLQNLSLLFDEYRVFYDMESDRHAALTFLRERMDNEDSIIYVALAGKELAGFVQLYPLFSSVRMKRLWLLNDLYVSEPYRGKKISSKLIDHAKELALETGAAGLSLETARSNVIANRLYLRNGFRPDQSHHFYTWDAALPVEKDSFPSRGSGHHIRLWL